MKIIIFISYIVLFQYQFFAQTVIEDSLFAEAKFYFYTFTYDSAATCIQQLLKLNPSSAKAYQLMGDIYRNENRQYEAIEMYKIAFSIDSTNLDIVRRIATSHIDLKNLAAARSILISLINKDSTLADFYVDLGDIAFKSGDTTKAIYYFSKAKEMKHNYTLACDNLGRMYLQKYQWQKAIDELFFVKMLNPWYPIQNGIRISSIMAESEFETWTKKYSNESEAHYYYSFPLFYKYSTDEALEEIKKAIKLNDQVKKYYLAETILLYYKKEYEKVIEELTNCLDIYPDCWECYNILAKTYVQISDTAKALEQAKTSLEIDSSIFSSLVIIAELYNRNKEFHLAIKNLNRALILQPYLLTPKLFYELAFAHYYLGDYKKAWGYINSANKITSLQGQESLFKENIREEINSLITEIWKNMD